MEKITLDHFVLLTVIGKGSYAKVVLVKKKVIINQLISSPLGYKRNIRYEDIKKKEY